MADMDDVYEGIESSLAPGLDLARGAYVGFMVGSSAFPVGIPLVKLAFGNVTDTGAMAKAGSALIKAGTSALKGADVVGDRIGSISDEQWSAADREAFEGKAVDYQARIILTSTMCIAAGACTVIVAVMIFVLIALLAVFALILAAMAVIFWYLCALLPWSLPAFTELQIQGEEFASTANRIGQALDKANGVLQDALGGGLVGFTSGNVAAQALLFGGGLQTAGDLVQAVVSGLDDALVGFCQRKERDWTKETFPGGPIGGGDVLNGGPIFTGGAGEDVPDTEWGT